MRKRVLALLVVGLIMGLASSTPVLAADRGSFHQDLRAGRVHHGFATVLVAPAYLYPYPVPVYGEPPPPMCYTSLGYWIRVPSIDATGYTTYYPQWVPERTVCP